MDFDPHAKISSFSKEPPEPKIYEGVVRDQRRGFDLTGRLWRAGFGRSRDEAQLLIVMIMLLIFGIAIYVGRDEYLKEVPQVSRATMDAAMQHTIGGDTVPKTNHSN